MREPAVFEAHASYVLDLLFTPDGNTLVTSGMDNIVKLWSVPEWAPLRTLEGHANSVNSISLSPSGHTLATGSTDQTVRLWSFPEGQILHTLQDRKKTVSSVQISADGKWVAAGSYGGRAAVWTLEGQNVVGIKASQKNLSSVAISPDNNVLATSGLGDDILLWSLPSGQPVGRLSGHETAVWSLTFLSNGRYLVSLGYEQQIKFWDTQTRQGVRSVQADDAGARGIAFSLDEKTAALSLEGKVQLWSVDDWTLVAELPVSTNVVNGMAFSPDGRWLAAGAADGKIRVWDRLD
jgi:WD40 repeat protein